MSRANSVSVSVLACFLFGALFIGCDRAPTSPSGDSEAANAEGADALLGRKSPPGQDKKKGSYWAELSAEGAGPPSGYTLDAAIDVENNQLYVCSGLRDYDTGTTLWVFDLETDTWSQISTSGWPSGKYRQCVLDPVADQLLTYWDGVGPVYAVPVTGGTWTQVGFDGEGQDHFEGASYWDPVGGQLSIFAGFGFGTFKNTLHEFDGTNFQVRTTSGDVPDGRFGPDVAIDAAAGLAYMAGRHRGAAGMEDDLHILDLATGVFTEPLAASATGTIDRVLAPIAFVGAAPALYRFGGYFNDGSGVSDYLDRLDLEGTAEWLRVDPNPESAIPPARRSATLVVDEQRARIILLGGFDAVGPLTDVWAFPVEATKGNKGKRPK